jgi:NADH:ubiquinone oxidoreductase subunit F (NADH-binding)
MNTKNIVEKLKKEKLLGRSGSEFSVGLKWEMVKNKKAKKKYIICNGAEGEPNVFKDGFILENYPEEVINGIKIALETIPNSSAYIYLRKDYYKKYKSKLEKLAKNLPITFFKKPDGYIYGEATTICEVIEGNKRSEPRIKPPFPTTCGLFGCPTLINNVETFYWVSKIAKNEYKLNRFYSISGGVKNKGVYELPENYTIEKILRETNNFPKFDFFVQSGGGASGEILLSNELNQTVKGAGALIIFDKKKTSPDFLMKKWADFFLQESCGKCVPCREGVYRIAEMVKSERIDKKTMQDILFVLENTSLCGFGKCVVAPFRSLIDKLL